jgi:cob(I)alamin adenosyltransferase
MTYSISTRTGDQGETGLLFGPRVRKTHPRMVACGAVDELSACLGLCRAHSADGFRRTWLEKMQHTLVGLMGELAVDEADRPRLESSRLRRLREDDLTALDETVATLEAAAGSGLGGDWTYPGATVEGAFLNQARVICRRAEQEVWIMHEAGFPANPLVGFLMCSGC